MFGDGFYNFYARCTEIVSASTSTGLSPVADSYVNNGATTTNYGTATSMVTKESVANDRAAFLKFDLRGLTGGSVSSATLKLYVKQSMAVRRLDRLQRVNRYLDGCLD